MGDILRCCGGRGYRVFAGRGPAASDLAGIYEDVGTSAYALGASSVPSFRFSTSESGGSATGAIRTSTGCFPFERKGFPPVSSAKGNHRSAFKGLREVSTTSQATHTGQYENLLRPRGVVRAASLQFEGSIAISDHTG